LYGILSLCFFILAVLQVKTPSFMSSIYRFLYEHLGGQLMVGEVILLVQAVIRIIEAVLLLLLLYKLKRYFYRHKRVNH
jgi:hypothetical protein